MEANRGHEVTVIVTRAGAPTLLMDGGRKYHVEVPPTHVVDATGAGDSFMAWVLADVAQFGPPTSSSVWIAYMERANRAAAATCRGTGGAESMPTNRSLDRSYLGSPARA